MMSIISKFKEVYRTKAIKREICKRRLEQLQSLYPEKELGLIPILVKKNTGSIDVGASIGIWSAHLIKRSSIVYSFEPGEYPESFKEVIRSLHLNIKWYNCALGQSKKLMSILYWPKNIQGLGTLNRFQGDIEDKNLVSKAVKITTLDSFNLGNISFIKIDVEGYEYKVLLGAQHLLAREKPVLLIECEERHGKGSLNKVNSLLVGLGYKGFFLLQDKCLPLSMFDHNSYQDIFALRDGVKATRSYVNNFIFIHQEDVGRLSALQRDVHLHTKYE